MKTYEKIILAVIFIVGLTLVGIGIQSSEVVTVLIGSLLMLIGAGIYGYKKL